MRIIVSILIAVVLLGGTKWYTDFAESVRAKTVTWTPDFADDVYSIEIDRSFDAVPDELFDDPAIVVRFRGAEIYRSQGEVGMNEAIRIDDVSNVEVGSNDFNITANLAEGADGLVAMRVRVFKGNAKIADQAITDTAELSSISGTVSFEAAAKPSDGDDHVGGH